MVKNRIIKGPSLPWLCGSWIYKCPCNQCLSSLMLWARILIRARCTTLCDKVCQWLATDGWFSPGTPVSSTNKTQGRIQDFKLRGAQLNNLRRAEGGAKFVGVFRVKNHDFTPNNHIFSNFRGGCAKFLGYFVWKITILCQKILFFPILGGGALRVRPPPPGSDPVCVLGVYVYVLGV